MLSISAHGGAENRGFSLRLFQLPPQAADQTLQFRDPLVGVGRGLFFLEDRAGLLRELLLPTREQAFVDLQFAADPRHTSLVLQNLQDGARFTLRGESEDRGPRIFRLRIADCGLRIYWF